MKTKLYALCGILWFWMDCFWFWHYNMIAMFLGVLTVATCTCGILIYHRKLSVELYVVIATFSWIMINLCSLAGETYANLNNEILNNFLKVFGLMYMIVGNLCLIAIFRIDHDFFKKFRKL